MIKLSKIFCYLSLACWVTIGLPAHIAIEHAGGHQCAADSAACFDCCDELPAGGVGAALDECHTGCACDTHEPHHSSADHSAASNARLKLGDAPLLALAVAVFDEPVPASVRPVFAATHFYIPDVYTDSSGLRAPPVS